MTPAAASFCQTPCWRKDSHKAAVAAVIAIATDSATTGRLKAMLAGVLIAAMPV